MTISCHHEFDTDQLNIEFKPKHCLCHLSNQHCQFNLITLKMENEELPDVHTAGEFYEKYEIKEVLGKGMSSSVRRCIRKKCGSEYAVKIIDITGETKAISDELRSITHNEINVLKEVSGQAHVIELFDVFETNSFIFLVFQLLRKGELFDYITEVVKFGEKQTRAIMRALFEAISFLHSKNIIHRDIKPENILLDEKLNIYLSDFGFATKCLDNQYHHELFGTPGYMAPEMLQCSINQDHPGYRSGIDVWACGVVMYTLLAGVPPFWHRRQVLMLRRIMSGEYSFPSPDWDDVSETAIDLIQKLLVVNPDNRLTATEALAHPFLQTVQNEQRYICKPFNALRKFRVAVHTVVATIRVMTLYQQHRPPKVATAIRNPYAIKQIRRLVDTAAFRIYGHWIKKVGDQSRAALYENSSKVDQLRVAQLVKESENNYVEVDTTSYIPDCEFIIPNKTLKTC